MCFLRAPTWEKTASQYLQGTLQPVWMFMCFFRLVMEGNDLSQTVHLHGRSSANKHENIRDKIGFQTGMVSNFSIIIQYQRCYLY